MDEPPSHLRFFIWFFIVSCICTGLSMTVSAGFVSGYFKPSVASGLPYQWTFEEWFDYCPACGHYDCLLINPKGVPESELTCSRCGADYCGVTGLDKGGGRWRVIRPRRIDTGVDLVELYRHI